MHKFPALKVKNVNETPGAIRSWIRFILFAKEKQFLGSKPVCFDFSKFVILHIFRIYFNKRNENEASVLELQPGFVVN